MHSKMFSTLKRQYTLGYVTKDTLRGRVELYKTKPAKGITEAEYEEITGEAYDV